MLLAALLLLLLLLFAWAKMSNPQSGEEEKPEQTPAEEPAAPTIAKPPAPNPPPHSGKAAAGEQEQIAVYNPAALRRPALAKFVLGSFDDNSSDDELVAAAFRVGSRRSSLAGMGGTGTELPAVTATPEPTASMRYDAWGREQQWCKDALVGAGRRFHGCISRGPCCSNRGVRACASQTPKSMPQSCPL